MKKLLCSLLVLAGCASVDYGSVSTGTFTGAAVVVWVGAGEAEILGDGEFLYVPVRNQALTFTRPQAPGTPPLTLRPEPFYTDGGSIPRAVQAFRGLNAWGYGPAYIIHDWLFVARKCLNDRDENGQVLGDTGQDLITDEIRKLAGLSFRDSAVLMAETIRTLAVNYDIDAGLSGEVISSVTAGPISRALWNETGACRDLQVTDPDHLQIIADLQGRTRDGLAETLGDTLRRDRILSSGGQEYRIIATYNLN